MAQALDAAFAKNADQPIIHLPLRQVLISGYRVQFYNQTDVIWVLTELGYSPDNSYSLMGEHNRLTTPTFMLRKDSKDASSFGGVSLWESKS